jgi:hypothetical protein
MRYERVTPETGMVRTTVAPAMAPSPSGTLAVVVVARMVERV